MMPTPEIPKPHKCNCKTPLLVRIFGPIPRKMKVLFLWVALFGFLLAVIAGAWALSKATINFTLSDLVTPFGG